MEAGEAALRSESTDAIWSTQPVNIDARFLPVPQQPLGWPAGVRQHFRTNPAAAFDGLPSADLPTQSYIVTLPDGTERTVLTSDPGRGVSTGDIREFGRFDVPTLFGIGKTAPYFHDNSAATLEQVIDHDQALFRFIQFADEKQALFAPPGANGEGCDQASAASRPSRKTKSRAYWRT